jgi:hypothetical protein
MTKKAVGFLGLMTILTIGLSAASVTGRWTLSVDTPHGDQDMSLVLKQDGKKVTGSIGNPHGGADIPLEGEFVDGALTFSTTADNGSEIPEMGFTGKLRADGALAGYLSTARGDTKCVARRVKE